MYEPTQMFPSLNVTVEDVLDFLATLNDKEKGDNGAGPTKTTEG
jgi:hypothetical protein